LASVDKAEALDLRYFVLMNVNERSDRMNIEQVILNNLRILSNEQQQEVLDFVKSLVQKVGKLKQVSSEGLDSSISSTTQEKKQLSLQEIAKLPVEKRHKLLAPYIGCNS
jgi:hypothetical protein